MPDLRAKLACSARSDNALRSGAMLAHEENSNASAYSVWSDRTFYCIGYSTIIINAAILIFVAEPIQQEVNETAFRDFQHIRCLHLEHTRPNVADVNPTQANAC